MTINSSPSVVCIFSKGLIPLPAGYRNDTVRVFVSPCKKPLDFNLSCAPDRVPGKPVLLLFTFSALRPFNDDDAVRWENFKSSLALNDHQDD
ncbi:hypothetical protein HC231_19440 [Brenneria izadpanahii]|uniref:Uncharacterized protein n=1 Tax=Brenneria izadpanahii TaxID=2722756 RepID=A0ABX7UWS7_9GAMM|nr:hypothetical protein [Brenneria izadpanahii]QTF09855.1 hypothetical protein HC231_19440 [Brenneria izadpanahii]